MLIDESGVVKQGQDSVGVAAQYCGSVGKVANSQVGVHLGYVSRQGYTLLDSQLFMPDEWFDEAHTKRRQACGVPAASIHPGPECTSCDPGGRFYSYRRDAGRTGQHLGFIYRLSSSSTPLRTMP